MKKRNIIITNIIIAVLILLLSLFILDGKQIYTIPQKSIVQKNEETIFKNLPSTNNIEFLKSEKFNNNSIYIYKIDDIYGIITYEHSMFLNLSSTPSFTNNIRTLDGYEATESNQVYDNSYLIKEKDNKIEVINEANINKTFYMNIVNIAVTILIVVLIYLSFFIHRKKMINNSEDNNN